MISNTAAIIIKYTPRPPFSRTKTPKYTAVLTQEIVRKKMSYEKSKLQVLFTSPSFTFIPRKISPKLPPPILRITLYLSFIIKCFLANNMRSKVAIFFFLHHSLSLKLLVAHRTE